jgi:lipopolysaccharide transport system ATP-binding protein
MTAAIRVSDLGKSYAVRHGGERANYRTLRESLAGLMTLPARRIRGARSGRASGEFWALKDVNFEVQPGEVVGIIGHNGAGKSTLLKILSRITRPTTGRIDLRGRVGSLLEVGTGFHPELTGRENIYLNGSILGMTRWEINRKFDEIVAFAGVDRFLDTPVKRYSSGMYVRLAFSVAAHLEPEILVIDEVLAVGDAAFQRRCIERMAELARSGSTLLFVSHSMDLIPKLCEKAILLEHGMVKAIGPADEVTAGYMTGLLDSAGGEELATKHRSGTGHARFLRLTILDGDGRPISSLRSGEDLRCLVEVQATRRVEDVSLGLVVKNLQGTRLVSALTDEVESRVALTPGIQRFECRFERVRIRPGRQVAIELWMFDGETIDHIDIARILDVIEVEPTGFSSRADQGAVLYDYSWTSLPTHSDHARCDG